MRGQRQQIDRLFLNVDRNLTCGLGRIGVEQHAVLASDAGQLGDRLESADHVVGGHDRH
jgi:hypothetical protein